MDLLFTKISKHEIFILRLRNKLNLFLLYFRHYIFPAILLIAVVAVTFYMAKPYFDNGFPLATTATSEQPVSPQPSLTIIETDTPNPEIFGTVTPTSLPTEITDAKGVSMVLVPAGEFTMGSENGDDDQRPAHTVFLDAFYMDKYEVTNALYKTCVSAGVCGAPQQTGSNTHSSYYGNSEFDNYPVIYVTWFQSEDYCEWREGKLPTEAQWEKAARGTDGRNYAWGDGIDCSKANYGDCADDTIKIGSYESGKSPYGIYDLTGNVWEWTADWYSATYYKSSPFLNPFGPNGGEERVVHGGSWGSDGGSEPRAFVRGRTTPDSIRDFVGFRCARDANP